MRYPESLVGVLKYISVSFPIICTALISSHKPGLSSSSL
nr:MAG TPA: protein of Unknown Function (DUF1907) [Caudoviricetes sp.]